MDTLAYKCSPGVLAQQHCPSRDICCCAPQDDASLPSPQRQALAQPWQLQQRHIWLPAGSTLLPGAATKLPLLPTPQPSTAMPRALPAGGLPGGGPGSSPDQLEAVEAATAYVGADDQGGRLTAASAIGSTNTARAVADSWNSAGDGKEERNDGEGLDASRRSWWGRLHGLWPPTTLQTLWALPPDGLLGRGQSHRNLRAWPTRKWRRDDGGGANAGRLEALGQQDAGPRELGGSVFGSDPPHWSGHWQGEETTHSGSHAGILNWWVSSIGWSPGTSRIAVTGS
jgi:hypothetical protein